jgi:hypothetical protein
MEFDKIAFGNVISCADWLIDYKIKFAENFKNVNRFYWITLNFNIFIGTYIIFVKDFGAGFQNIQWIFHLKEILVKSCSMNGCAAGVW